MRIGWSGWSIDVPESWSVTDDPECLTLELSKYGALQASSATKQSGTVSFDDLVEFADVPEQEAWGAASVVACGEFRGLSYKYEQDGSTWQRWYLCNGATLVFVTYNGTSGVVQHELSAVSAALDSLRVEREA
jgi:hypothetical protein